MAKEAKAVETTEVAPQKTVKAKTVEPVSYTHLTLPTTPYV